MATNFQPPPTWAPVILETVDPASGQKNGTFNPVWLKWFVDLAALLSNSGGGTANSGGGPGTLSAKLTEKQVGVGDANNLLNGDASLTWDAGTLILQLGGDAVSGDGPVVTIISGKGQTGAHAGGELFIKGPNDSDSGIGASIEVDGAYGGGAGGDVQGNGGNGALSSNGGSVQFYGGNGGDTGNGGITTISSGSGGATSGDGGNNIITSGSSTLGNAGDVLISLGTTGGGGRNGLVVITSLPTVAPLVSGALWRDAGAGNVVKCVP
jgi:hypothetical protein